jgi:hypothetical protein
MFLNQAAWALIGLLLAAWTVAAAWAVLAARARQRRAEASARLARRLGRMIDDAPALPMVVRADGRIEGPSRLAGWFGCDARLFVGTGCQRGWDRPFTVGRAG